MGLMQRFIAGLRWPATAKAASSRSVVCDAQHMGPYTDLLSQEPRSVNPWLYEALREAIGPIDGAINRLVTMDGIIAVRGGNDALVDEIRDWLQHVPVGDLQTGLQAAYAGQGNEAYEQGFSIAEWVTDRSGRDIVAVHVADSKGVVFRRARSGGLEAWYRPPQHRAGRADGTDQLERVLRGGGGGAGLIDALGDYGYRRIDPARMLYVAVDPEAGRPYGVSKIRSTEFASQILLKIQNATGNVWGRWGDPPLSLTYKTRARGLTQADLDERRNRLAADLAATMSAKRSGNSVDFVQAVAADDTITIEVIGAADKLIEIEMPARHMLEQIVAKFGIPSWMLGFHWSTAERLADAQSTIVLQESKTRFEGRRAPLEHLVATMLRLRGRTWRPGDWELYQELPNLQDELRQAQASFLRAQEQMMLRGVTSAGELPGTSAEAGGAAGGLKAGQGARVMADGGIAWGDAVTAAKADPAEAAIPDDVPASGEPWADSDPELPRIEAQLRADLEHTWNRFADTVLAELGLPDAKSATGTAEDLDHAKAGGWVFAGGAMVGVLMAAADAAIARIAGRRGPLVRAAFDVWLRGVIRAAEDLDRDPLIGEMADRVRADLATHALALVRRVFDRAWRHGVLRILEDGLLNGLPPRDVARRLRRAFGGALHDWRRLAASELAAAHGRGKRDEYEALGQELYDFVTATDSGVCRICRTHAEAGPYKVSDGAPLPMTDTHPFCRCTIAPHDPGAGDNITPIT